MMLHHLQLYPCRSPFLGSTLISLDLNIVLKSWSFAGGGSSFPFISSLDLFASLLSTSHASSRSRYRLSLFLAICLCCSLRVAFTSHQRVLPSNATSLPVAFQVKPWPLLSLTSDQTWSTTPRRRHRRGGTVAWANPCASASLIFPCLNTSHPFPPNLFLSPHFSHPSPYLVRIHPGEKYTDIHPSRSITDGPQSSASSSLSSSSSPAPIFSSAASPAAAATASPAAATGAAAASINTPICMPRLTAPSRRIRAPWRHRGTRPASSSSHHRRSTRSSNANGARTPSRRCRAGTRPRRGKSMMGDTMVG